MPYHQSWSQLKLPTQQNSGNDIIMPERRKNSTENVLKIVLNIYGPWLCFHHLNCLHLRITMIILSNRMHISIDTYHLLCCVALPLNVSRNKPCTLKLCAMAIVIVITKFVPFNGHFHCTIHWVVQNTSFSSDIQMLSFARILSSNSSFYRIKRWHLINALWV